ncbi:MAG: T9SS type A sorting domain-containing protein [Prevotellaceae bacterium]|nr:T9SS type A sorting domain-containing protein [Prevotellaceae bacterium]
MQYRRYYKKAPPPFSISGPDNPYSIQQVTYTIPNLPSGTTVTWSGDDINIISGQGTSQVTISVCDGYTTTLTATLSGSLNYVITKNISVNNGTVTYINSDYIEVTFNHPYAENYHWYISNVFNIVSGSTINSNPILLTLANPSSGTGVGLVKVRGSYNGCYTGVINTFVNRYLITDNLLSYSAAYPNPAGNELIIDKIEEENSTETTINTQNTKVKNTTVKVLLYSHSTTKLVYNKDFPSATQQIKIDTSKLPNGVYYLNIIENGEKIKEQTIIVNH